MLRRRAMLLGTLGNAARARESVTKALALHCEAGAELDVLTDLLIDAELAALRRLRRRTRQARQRTLAQ